MKKSEINYAISNLLVVAIVAIVAIVTMVSSGGSLEGASVHTESGLERQVSCSSSDPSLDKYVAGDVRLGGSAFYDYCINDHLYQRYCASSNNVGLRGPTKCLNGCLNGACLP